MSFVGDIFSGLSNPEFPLVRNISASTDALGLSSISSGANVSTALSKKGSAPQTAFGIRFPRILSDIDKLRGTLTPGFSQVRSSRLAAVDNARDKAIGNLRDNLARRKVRGSSFGFDALSGAEAEFGQARADEEAKVFFEELQANQQLIAQEHGILGEALNRELAELGMTAQFSTTMADIISRGAQFSQQLAAQEAAGKMELLGTALGAGLGSFGFGGAFGQGGKFGKQLSLSPSGGGGMLPLPAGANTVTGLPWLA